MIIQTAVMNMDFGIALKPVLMKDFVVSQALDRRKFRGYFSIHKS